MTTTNADVVIVGGGAAGLSAALMLSRSRRSVIVLDAGTTRNRFSEHLHGFLGYDGMSPGDLLDAGRKEATSYGVTIHAGTVNEIACSDDPARQLVSWDGGTIACHAVIVAAGLRDELPAIPGLADGWGRWAFHCPYCHGYEIGNAPVAVVGGENPAFSLKQAGLLTQLSTHVTFYLNDMPVSEADVRHLTDLGVEVSRSRILAMQERSDGQVELVFDGSTNERFDALFVGPTFIPNDGLLKAAGCALAENGFVAVDTSGRTSRPGLWAAGNVVSSPAQLINAAADGANAAISVNDTLVFESPATAYTG